MTTRTADGTALAQAVRDRRRTLHLRQHDLEPRGGPTLGTVRRVERTRGPITITDRVAAELERGLAWPEGTVDDLLRGHLTPAGAAALPTETAAPDLTPVGVARDVARRAREDLIRRGRTRPDAQLRCSECGEPLPPTEPSPSLFLVDEPSPAPEGKPARAEASAWFGSGLAWGVAWLDRVLAALDGETDPGRLTPTGSTP